MKKKRYFETMAVTVVMVLATAFFTVSCTAPEDGCHELLVLSTGDVHGRWFDTTFTDGKIRGSLPAVCDYVKRVRATYGEENVLLLDAGDQLDGSEAAFYFNGVDTETPHLFPRMAVWMRYDALVPGHADFERGHEVYDRVALDLTRAGIPYLAANVLDKAGKPYFSAYRIFKKAGLKVAVIGFANSDMASLVDTSAVSGLRFENILSCAQREIDKVRRKEKPHVIVVAAHTGMGKGDGEKLQQQGLDMLGQLRGADVIIAAHDHRAQASVSDSVCFMDSGKYCGEMGQCKLRVEVKNGKIVSKGLSAEIVRIDASEADTAMCEAFRNDYLAVRSFVRKPVGEIKAAMSSREAYGGSCDYANFYHAAVLSYACADISFHAPLAVDGIIAPGPLAYGDMSKVYPFANKLMVIRMTGREVKDYLEKSYDNWIVTGNPAKGAVLKMKKGGLGSKKWNFANSPGNFDSAGGLHYTVDVTKPYGSKVSISATADGKVFDLDREYKVAITSYRSGGAGGLLQAAGINPKTMEERVVARGPEYRTLLYRYLLTHPAVESASLSNPALVGSWKFIPEIPVQKAIKKDLELLLAK